MAREYELAIPHELPRAGRTALVREFSQYLAERYGVAVDFAIHGAHWRGDQRNYHAHVLTTTREVTPEGLGAKTALELSETDRARRGMRHSREEFVEIRECIIEKSLKIRRRDVPIILHRNSCFNSVSKKRFQLLVLLTKQRNVRRRTRS